MDRHSGLRIRADTTGKEECEMRSQLMDLRRAMEDRGITYYLVVTDDYHASEYTGSYFKCRAYLSGFTGSAGSCVVSQDWAGLWTDGRYFLQAADQLKDTGFELCKMGEEGVPTIEGYFKDHLKPGDVLAFDGRTVSMKDYRKYLDIASHAGARLLTDVDLVGDIWKDRPPLSAEPVFELSVEYAGKTRAEKLRELREKLKDMEVDILLLSSLMDINWLLNIRGNDVACTPVVLCYAMISDTACRW